MIGFEPLVLETLSRFSSYRLISIVLKINLAIAMTAYGVGRW
jgi:hypothetical protein